MLAVSFLVQDDAWKKILDKDRVFYRNALKQAFTALDLPKKKYTVSIALMNDADIKVLNKQFRQKNKATNVLSFPQYETLDALVHADDPIEMGDIAVALETLKAEAKEQKKTLRNHAAHLLVHGLLHLAGYDHMDDAHAAEMEGLEILILAGLKIKNPYAA